MAKTWVDTEKNTTFVLEALAEEAEHCSTEGIEDSEEELAEDIDVTSHKAHMLRLAEDIRNE